VKKLKDMKSKDAVVTHCYFWGKGKESVLGDLLDIVLNDDGTYSFGYDGWGFIHPSGWKSHGKYVADAYRRNSWLPNWLLKLCEKNR